MQGLDGDTNGIMDSLIFADSEPTGLAFMGHNFATYKKFMMRREDLEGNFGCHDSIVCNPLLVVDAATNVEHLQSSIGFETVQTNLVPQFNVL